jgi:ABC-type glycerol-3-phosphate transport system substrate-binding protein
MRTGAESRVSFYIIGIRLAPLFLSIALLPSQAAERTLSLDVLTWNRANSLQTYLRETAGRPEPSESLRIPALSYHSSQGAQLEALKELDGEEDVLAWTNGDGWVEYRVRIHQAGSYAIGLRYYQLPAKGMSIEMGLEIDGAFPFTDAEAIVLNRIWRDAEAPRRDPYGNDILPAQEEAPAWQTADFMDTQGFYNQVYPFYLSEGEHVLRLHLNREALAIKELLIHPRSRPPAYRDVLKAWKSAGAEAAPAGTLVKVQAERSFLKSDSSLVPTYDRSEPASEPFSPAKVWLNTIGQWNWKTPGSWISWKVDVPADGLYQLHFKARQNFQRGMTVSRHLLVDGKPPYAEARDIEFPYSLDWSLRTVMAGGEGGRGEPALVYLEKGSHEIRLEASLGRLASILSDVDEYAYQINGLYRKFVMIMGAEPDIYRDYDLEKEIPGLKDFLVNMSVKLNQSADQFEAVSGQRGTEAATLRTTAIKLRDFAKRPETIPRRMKSFSDNINGLAAWIIYRREQPLEMDYLLLSGPGTRLPKPRAGALTRLVSGIKAFLASFTEDYTSISAKAGGRGAISVWAGTGRDQAQVIMDMINDYFTPETGVRVNLSLVQGGLVEATLAGRGPDICLQVARGQPVNLAARGALAELSGFPGYTEVEDRFAEGAMLPYSYRGGVYGLPITQSFYMMFYRKDVFRELGLEPPRTWEDVYRLIPELQRNNMEVGLPIQTIDAQELIDAGMGARNLFPTLLVQNQGSFYSEDFSKSGLDSAEAVKAFSMWTDFYTRYGFILKYTFSERFRTGQMPIGIAPYTLYNLLSVSAPEIRNEWAMLPIPGMLRADGSLDRSETASGSACVMFSKAKDKDACWKFMEWWTRPEVQYRYARQLEILMGPAARLDTANLETFDMLPWSRREAANIKEQWRHVKEIPEVPGGYLLVRAVDMAFNKVYYDNYNPREILAYYNVMVNEEIRRKRKELGIDAP